MENRKIKVKQSNIEDMERDNLMALVFDVLAHPENYKKFYNKTKTAQ